MDENGYDFDTYDWPWTKTDTSILWRFLTAFTSARHLSLFWATSIQSMFFHLTFWRCILVLSPPLCLGLPICLLPSGLSTKTVCISLVSHTCHMPLPVSFFSVWSLAQHLVDFGQRTVPNSRDITAKIHIYRVSQEEWTKLRESVPYVKLLRR